MLIDAGHLAGVLDAAQAADDRVVESQQESDDQVVLVHDAAGMRVSLAQVTQQVGHEAQFAQPQDVILVELGSASLIRARTRLLIHADMMRWKAAERK
jgi:hypothetical protein